MTPTYYTSLLKGGDLCMIGGIYENKGKYGSRYRVKFKSVYKRFNSLEEAERFLTGLRFQYDNGSFDVRDWQKDKPLGFENLGTQWLDYRKQEVRCFRNLNYHLVSAFNYFGNRNIKEIQFAELEDFLRSLPQSLSGKSKKNILTTLHSFFNWLQKRGFLSKPPTFPKVTYTLGWRNTVSKETQQAIIEEVKRISYSINPKVWIGIKWLAMYVSIRPIELTNIKEGDFDLQLGVVNVRHNKENKPKIVPLLDEDIKLVKSFPKALPGVYFFRHGKRKGVHNSKRGKFGKDYLYTWWKRSCRNLGIFGIDLYGGTRHSSVRALREYHTPEEIKRATMHHTNVAFERYFRIEMDDVREVYADTQGKAKVIKLEKAL